MEKMSTSTLLSSELIGFLILEAILSLFSILCKLSTRFSPLLSWSSVQMDRRAPKKNRKEESRTEQNVIISSEDAELVMKNMRLGVGGGGEKMKELLSLEDVAAMFEEKEPSLEEVKEAFAVFDENGDGFVEAGELHRVFCRLGFEGGVGLDSCGEMIARHDDNGDGRIDFGEFVKFMESGFC